MTLTRELPVAIGEVVPGYDVVVAPEVVEGRVIYVARHPALPRVFSQGSTPDEAVADLAEVRDAYLADMRAAGEPVPDPVAEPSIRRLELGPSERRTALSIDWTIKTFTRGQ